MRPVSGLLNSARVPDTMRPVTSKTPRSCLDAAWKLHKELFLCKRDTGIRSGQGWSSTWRLSTLQRRSTDEVSASAEKLFRDLKREANEEGFPEPSYEAAVKAQYMLESLEHRLLPSPAETYPTPDGEIAIDIRGGYRKGLLLLYERKGSVLMLLTIDGVHQRAYFDKPPRHVNGFLQDALHELISAAVPAA